MICTLTELTCVRRRWWWKISNLVIISFAITAHASSNTTSLRLALWEPTISNGDGTNIDGIGGIFAMLGLYLVSETLATNPCVLNEPSPKRSKVKRQDQAGYYWDEDNLPGQEYEEDVRQDDEENIVSSYLTMAIKRNPGIYYKYCRHKEGAFANSQLCLGDKYDVEGASNPVSSTNTVNAAAAASSSSSSKDADNQDSAVEFFNSEFPGTIEGISTPVDRIWLILFPLLEAYLKVFSESSNNNIFSDAVWVYNRETNQARFGYKFRYPNPVERAGVYLKFEEARWTFAIGQANDLTLGIPEEQLMSQEKNLNQTKSDDDALCEEKAKIQKTSTRTIRDYIKMAENVALYMGWTTNKDFCFDVVVGLWDASLTGEVIINAIETDEETSRRYAEYCIPRMSKRKYLAMNI